MIFLPNSPKAGKSLRYDQKNNPRNINYMPVWPGRFSIGVVIFFICFDLEQKSSFMDGHNLRELI
jgi:hypothetical protein